MNKIEYCLLQQKQWLDIEIETVIKMRRFDLREATHLNYQNKIYNERVNEYYLNATNSLKHKFLLTFSYHSNDCNTTTAFLH